MKRMLINAIDTEESRIAVVEDGVLQELHVEIANREAYLGNIYKGRIVNIEPSIGAAFVNFGGRSNGFLHISDVLPAYGSDEFTLSDIIEGRARVSGEEGPEAVRSVLSDGDSDDDEEEVDFDQDDDQDDAESNGTDDDAGTERAEIVQVGEPFSINLHVDNKTDIKRTILAIYVVNEYLQGIDIESSSPPFTAAIELPGFISYSYDLAPIPIPTWENIDIALHARGRVQGDHSGDIWVCISRSLETISDVLNPRIWADSCFRDLLQTTVE